jgi:hypothetical protein
MLRVFEAVESADFGLTIINDAMVYIVNKKAGQTYMSRDAHRQLFL